MKKFFMLVSSLSAVLATSGALAKSVDLRDDAALAFYERHADELESVDGTPRMVGVFHYTDKHRVLRQGYADCWIQPRGEAVFCTIQY